VSTIVHLFGSLDPGGAEVRTLEELRARRRPDEHHVFVALSGRVGALEPQFEAIGCEIVHRRLSPSFPVWFVGFLRRRRPTHVHSHVHLASGYFLLLAAAAAVPRRVAHFRSMGDGRAGSVRRKLYRSTARALLALFATDLVAVSGSVRDVALGRSTRLGRRCTVMYNRIDQARFPAAQAPQAGRARLITVGRVDAGKNPLRAVSIVAELVERGAFDDVSLTFVGRGSPDSLAEVQRHARALGVEASIDVLGERDDVPLLLAGSDLLLATTFREGLPGAILESSAAGIPAVVSAIAPNEEAGRWLPGVTVVPLDAGDEVWCSVIEDAIRGRTDRLSPAEVRAGFDRSPFALRGPNAELDRLWS